MLRAATAPDIEAERFEYAVTEMAQAIAFGDLTDALTECVELADKDIGRNFAAAAGPHSGAWPARKRDGKGQKRGEGHPLLIKTGALFQAATSPFGKGHVQEVFPRGAEIGIDPAAVPYAAAQNYGFADRNLPQREFEDVSDATMDVMAELVADQVIDLLNG